MDLFTAEREAKMLMAAHSLTGWTFKWDNAKRRAGCCFHSARVISLSRPLTKLRDTDDVRNTVLHEIAHAIAGHRAGHGPEWVTIARRIGCNGQRCYESTPETTVPHKWVGICPNGHTAKRHRKPSKVRSCGACSEDFDARFIIKWKPASLVNA